MSIHILRGALRATAALALGLGAAVHQASATNVAAPLQAGHEYMMVVNRPNNLHVLDMAGNSVYKTCTLPDDFGPGMTQVSPDRRTAYILNNHFGDIYGVDLDSCKLSFRARMSQAPGERSGRAAHTYLSPRTTCTSATKAITA